MNILEKGKAFLLKPETKEFASQTAQTAVGIAVVALVNLGIHVVAETLKNAISKKDDSSESI